MALGLEPGRLSVLALALVEPVVLVSLAQLELEQQELGSRLALRQDQKRLQLALELKQAPLTSKEKPALALVEPVVSGRLSVLALAPERYFFAQLSAPPFFAAAEYHAL